MWRDFVRATFLLLGIIEKPTLVVRFVDRHPAPEDMLEGVLIVVRGGRAYKWACFRCPGGCGHRFQLSLNPARRPRWAVTTDWLNRPTLTPSVLQTTACRAHFWVRQGHVDWCADSGSHVGLN